MIRKKLVNNRFHFSFEKKNSWISTDPNTCAPGDGFKNRRRRKWELDNFHVHASCWSSPKVDMFWSKRWTEDPDSLQALVHRFASSKIAVSHHVPV